MHHTNQPRKLQWSQGGRDWQFCRGMRKWGCAERLNYSSEAVSESTSQVIYCQQICIFQVLMQGLHGAHKLSSFAATSMLKGVWWVTSSYYFSSTVKAASSGGRDSVAVWNEPSACSTERLSPGSLCETAISGCSLCLRSPTKPWTAAATMLCFVAVCVLFILVDLIH